MSTILKQWTFASAVMIVASLVALFLGARAAHALITVTMGPGDSGSHVSELQTFLAMDTSIYPEGLVTGYYGERTTAAVERFQCTYGIVCSGTPEMTGYGRVGPVTLAKIRERQGGVSLPPVGVPPVGTDVWAPVLYPPTAATTSNSAAISWTTNEQARHRVMYGTMWPFLYASAPSQMDATFDTTAAVIIPGLLPNTTYHYVRESVDASGNIQYGIGTWFRTGT